MNVFDYNQLAGFEVKAYGLALKRKVRRDQSRRLEWWQHQCNQRLPRVRILRARIEQEERLLRHALADDPC